MFKKPLQTLAPVLGLVSKREVLTFSLIYILLGLSEALGIAMILPVMKYIEVGGEAFTPEDLPALWSGVLSIVTNAGVPITLTSLLTLSFAPMILRRGFLFLQMYYSSKVQEGIIARIRERGFRAFVGTDLQYHARRKHGELMVGLTNQADMAGDITNSLLGLIGGLLQLVIFVGLLLFISPLVTLVAFATGLVGTGAVGRAFTSKTRNAGEAVASGNVDMYSSITEEISGIRLIKLQGQEDTASRKVQGLIERVRTALIRLRVANGLVSAAIEAVFIIGLFSIVFIGVEVVGLSLAKLGVLVIVLLRLMPQANTINGFRQVIISGIPSLLMFKELIEEAEQSLRITSGSVPFSGLKKDIEFTGVGFSYDNTNKDIWALRDVSFTIPTGEMTAIVGRSGAGKSTLVDLIPRLREASYGKIAFDGIDIKDLDLTTLRRAIGFLSQETFLFHDTIYNNITYGCPTATSDQVIKAANHAYAHDFIQEATDGYETVGGDRGVRLSAGQRQRLGIARVMLQDPDIIILDEPTSALDSESEHYIQRALDEIRAQKTLIVIAHRLSTIQQADRIIVLDNGHVVEQGDHKLLLERNGDYSRLFDLQIQG